MIKKAQDDKPMKFNKVLSVRIYNDEVDKLNEVCSKTGATASDILRKGLLEQFDKVLGNEK